MRILLIRHGQSEGNIDENAYIQKGDHMVGLTDEGWRQAIGTGQFLADYYKKNEVDQWPTLYLSSYTRPKQTLSGIMHGMNGSINGKPKLYEDPRLIEKFFGATNHIHNPDGILDLDVAKALRDVASAAYKADPFTTKNFLGESSKDMLLAMKGFLDGTFTRDVAEGKDEFMFVVHGAVIQAFLMSWAHLPMTSKSMIKNPGNGDVIKISGEPKNWIIRKIYDGEKYKAVNDPIIDHIKPFSFEDLPPVPESFSIG